MYCPKCNIPLVISDRQHVEIDHCPQCRGIWLDRGELDKVIDRTTAQLNRSRTRDDDDDYGPLSAKRGKGKRGFLGELFDF